MSLLVQNTIIINAPATRVWDLLTNPAETKKYMFGCETVSDWKKNSPLRWELEYEGKPFVAVKGTIVDIQPGELLVYTTIDPNNPSIPDVPENYLTVTYRLKAEGDSTILHVTQGDYSTVADGERRYKEAYNNGEGWNPILQEIKKIAEEEPA